MLKMRRRPSPAPTLHTRSADSLRAARCARDFADALERATDRKQWGLAERLVNAALQLPPEHRRNSGLCERIARLRAQQGNWNAALAVVDSCGSCSSSLRLLRAACLLQLWRRDEAHLDLRQWASRASAPLAARSMLALLEWQIGDELAACDALTSNLKHIEDPHSLALLMLIAQAADNREQTERWATRLRAAAAHSPDATLFNAMFHSIGLQGVNEMQSPIESAQVDALAMELLANEAAIPALVEAQRLAPEPAIIRLLGLAIERVLRDLDDCADGYVALVDLAHLTGDAVAANRWARLGARACPMSAALAQRANDLQVQLSVDSCQLSVLTTGDGQLASDLERAA